MTNVLGSIGMAAIERRGIDAEIAVRCGLHTIRWDAETQTAIPDAKGNVVAFPFVEGGNVVAEKYRAPNKKFWQRKGGRKTFWNADALDDPALESGTIPLVITEGELDALSAMTAGFPLAVSVPDGAPPPITDTTNKSKETDEQSGKFEFLWNNRDRLRRIKRFILAVDSDAPGRRLADELVRRLSAARCSFIEYPTDCKDLNDVLRQNGPEAVAGILNRARPYPVHGLYRLEDYPRCQALDVYSTGWPVLDPFLKLFPGEFMVVSGIPGHGKTIWTLNLAVQMAQQYAWTTAIYSAEMPVTPQLVARLRNLIGGSSDHFINSHFLFIDADPRGKEETPDFSIEWLLERATDAVMRYGIRMLIIDPWNEVEHAKDSKESTTDYIGRSIRSIKAFAKRYQVVTIVVAHPTKEISKDGKTRTPTLYDVEGSSHWANKADHGIIIERSEFNQAKVWIVKSRFEEAGERGMVNMLFDNATHQFFAIQHNENANDR